jgi:hypothetical protein
VPELVCYRAAAYRTPIRSRPHGPDSGGRFHDPGGPATQYFTLHPQGAWAEIVRNQRWTSVEGALEARLPVWAIRLVVSDEPLLIDFDRAAAAVLRHPISPEELVDDNPAACRALARAHRADPGLPGVLRVPSAALPGTENVVVLAARRGIEYLAAPRRESQIPYASTAVDGHLAAGLFPHIRRLGQPHAGLEAWRRGEAFTLPEVAATAA